METRSRKRVEGISQGRRPDKRARLQVSVAISSSSAEGNLHSHSNSRPEHRVMDSDLSAADKIAVVEPGTEPISNPSDTDSHENPRNDDGFGNNSNSALEGILRKLGENACFAASAAAASSSSSSFSQQTSRFRKILSGLGGEENDEDRQLEALSQLCEILSIATEDSLSGFSVESFVPVLGKMLSHESNPEIMLLAARALTHLCDALPQACGSVVHHGAVASLCERLLAIEYMDLAEQSLEALEKISYEHPVACLRAGGLMAVLSFLDFFSTGVQRAALSTAANICKRLPADAEGFVMGAVPILTNLLNYHDSKVVEYAAICLISIVESFSQSSKKLDELCDYGVVTQIGKLILNALSQSGPANLTASTFTGLIRALCKFARGSALATKALLELNASGMARDILYGSNAFLSISSSTALDRPPDQIHETLNLLNELLPPVPGEIISLPSNYSRGSKCSGKEKVLDNSKSTVDNLDRVVRDVTSHVKLLLEQPDLLAQFGLDMFPILVQLCSSSVSSSICHKCIAIISKLVYYGTADMLITWHRVTNITSFLAGILSGKDPYVFVSTLQISEVLMEKLPDTLQKLFVKDGVVHAVDSLLSRSMNILQTSSSGESASVKNVTPSNEANENASEQEMVKITNHGNTSATDGRDSELDVHEAICAQAKRFRDKYFHPDSNVANGRLTESLSKLKNLCVKLNIALESNVKTSQSSVNEECLSVVLSDILEEVVRDDGVSMFELIESGVIPSLLKYFSVGAFSEENMITAPENTGFNQTLKRFNLFIELALLKDADNVEKSPLMILIQKLQDALSSLESFPVILSDKEKWYGDSTSILASLSVLGRPVKLCFSRVEGEDSLKDYSNNTVIVASLANLETMEEFLWSRIQINELPENALQTAASITETEPRPHNISKGKEKTDAVDTMDDRLTSENGVNKGEANNISKESAHDYVSTEEEDMESEDDHYVERSELRIPHGTEVVHHIHVGESDGIAREEIAPVESTSYLPPNVNSQEEIFQKVQSSDLAREAMFPRRSYPSIRETISERVCITSRSTGGSKDSQVLPLAYPGARTPRLIFYMGSKQLDRSLSLYQLIQAHANNRDDEKMYVGSEYSSFNGRRLLSETYHVTYKRFAADDKHAEGNFMAHDTSYCLQDPISGEQSRFLEKVLKRKSPLNIDKADITYNILVLLQILEGINCYAPQLHAFQGIMIGSQGENINNMVIPQEAFLCNKLTLKILRQLQDPLTLCSRGMPSWCYQLMGEYPFLFPFESRKQFFYSVSFGLSRALHKVQQQQASESSNLMTDREVHIGRVERQKVRVSRNHILDAALKVMETYCSHTAFLEVEYFGEVGTGLGPTLEFYTLLSHEFQKQGLGMWRSDPCCSANGISAEDMVIQYTEAYIHEKANEGHYVLAPEGLFPCPWSPNAKSSSGSQFSRVLQYFRLLGQVFAKALKDGRLLDIHLSSAFYKTILGKELGLFDIKSFDKEFGNSLEKMYAVVQRKHAQRSSHVSDSSDLNLEDLYLDFTLPGYPDYALKPGGDKMMVNNNNLEEYISLVVDATLQSGISSQMNAFRDGFNEVFPISHLRIFSVFELESLLCGGYGTWTVQTLADCINFDHGYTATSPPIIHLLEILGDFTVAQQRDFLRFVTGSPRLPPGGLAALNPKLTIVRKHFALPNGEMKGATFEVADRDLPSAMTCANYLKLPAYSSKEVMRNRLLYAITEGQGSFDLS